MSVLVGARHRYGCAGFSHKTKQDQLLFLFASNSSLLWQFPIGLGQDIQCVTSFPSSTTKSYCHKRSPAIQATVVPRIPRMYLLAQQSEVTAKKFDTTKELFHVDCIKLSTVSYARIDASGLVVSTKSMNSFFLPRIKVGCWPWVGLMLVAFFRELCWLGCVGIFWGGILM